MSISKWIQKNTKSLENKTVVITGTTNGLGHEALKLLVGLKANIIVGVRNTARAEEQKKQMLEKNHDANITIFKLDLADTSSIKNFSNKVTFLCQAGIDVLINNAGVYSNIEVLPNGHEKHFFTNCIAPLMLTKNLLPLIKSNENSKIVFLGSLSCNFSKIDFNDIDFRNSKRNILAYANSKRWLTFAALELKKELEPAGVCVNIVHPGISATALFKSWALKIFNPLMKILFPRAHKACLCEIAGSFFETNQNEWIGPTVFGVWGKPKCVKLKIKHRNDDEISKCYEKLNQIISEISKM